MISSRSRRLKGGNIRVFDVLGVLARLDIAGGIELQRFKTCSELRDVSLQRVDLQSELFILKVTVNNLSCSDFCK